MNCKPCQRMFVQADRLLSALRDEKLSPIAENKARELAVSIMVVGEYLTAKEVQEIGQPPAKGD